jgi:glycosyltransferase involved in cell wall biosynthesis
MEGYGAFGRGVVIENGVDLERFAGALAMDPTSLPFDPRRAILGYVGRFDRVKRLETLVEAVGRIKGCNPLMYEGLQLVLVGYGAEEERLKAEVLKWGIFGHVTFTGPSMEVERWYKSFSCYCLPSDAEGFGLTLVEAMAAGVPVVAARTAISERIVGKGGDFFGAGDAKSLAVVVQEVIARKKANPGLGRVAAGKLELYSEVTMAQQYYTFFGNFLKLPDR